MEIEVEVECPCCGELFATTVEIEVDDYRISDLD